MPKTLTIRLTNDQAKALDQAMDILGEKTAAKALIKSMEKIVDANAAIESIAQDYERLQAENQSLRQTLSNATESATLLLQQANQSDAFINYEREYVSENARAFHELQSQRENPNPIEKWEEDLW